MDTPQRTDSAFPPPGDPRLLSDIQRRTPRTDGDLHHLPGGIALTQRIRRAFPYTLPFHPLSLHRTQDGNTNAILRPGVVIVRHLERWTRNIGGGLDTLEPQIGNSSMWALPAPELTLNLDASNQSWNYLYCETNPNGNPRASNIGNTAAQTEFQILSYATEQTNTTAHHYPRDPLDSDGSNGTYLIPLFETHLDSTNTGEQIVLRWGGHYPWDDTLWEGQHQAYGSGTTAFDPDLGARPFEKFDEDANINYFRTHTSNHGHNVVEDGFNILHRFVGENIGNCNSNTANVYSANTNATNAGFNILCERENDPQVRVLQAAGVASGQREGPIEIQGNGKDATLYFTDCSGNTVAEITFIDGLITVSGNYAIPLGDCSNSNS